VSKSAVDSTQQWSPASCARERCRIGARPRLNTEFSRAVQGEKPGGRRSRSGEWKSNIAARNGVLRVYQQACRQRGLLFRPPFDGGACATLKPFPRLHQFCQVFRGTRTSFAQIPAPSPSSPLPFLLHLDGVAYPQDAKSPNGEYRRPIVDTKFSNRSRILHVPRQFPTVRLLHAHNPSPPSSPPPSSLLPPSPMPSAIKTPITYPSLVTSCRRDCPSKT